MTDHISPCPFCHERPGTRVGPPAVARCVTERCEGSKLAAVTIDRWNAAASRSSSGTKLLPCPFCGGEPAITLGVRGTIKTVDVVCQDCWATMPCHFEEDAIKDWNTRDVAQPPTIPVTRETAEPTQYLIDQFRDHGSKPSAKAASDALRAAAERVCWFDWSDNDMDAVAAIDALRKAIVVSSTAPDPSLQKMQISTRNAVIEECARVADRWGDGEATMAAAEIRMLKTSPVSSTTRASPIDHSDEECPNFPGCHCVDHCCDGWKHPSPEVPSTTRVFPCDPNDPRPIWEQGLGAPPAETARRIFREWCARNGIVLEPLCAADLVARIEAAMSPAHREGAAK